MSDEPSPAAQTPNKHSMDTQETLAVLSSNENESVDLFKSLIEDIVKFRSKGTASAAARARKSASTLAKLLKVVRKDLQDAKKQNAVAKKAAV